jgi:AcrR family transcriptional regulator
VLLLDAAERVFARRGYRGASLDEIAEEAGFSKGAVYSNFASKEDLFLALLDRRRIGPAGSGRSPTPDDLSRLAAPTKPEAWEWGLLTLEFFLYAAREPTVRERLAAAFEDQRAELAALLTDGRPTVGAGAFTPRELATVALALGTGLGVQAVLDPTAIPADLHARVIGALTRPGDGGEP